MFAIFNRAKDWAIGEIARIALNRFEIQKYGTMTQFTIDSEKRELSGSLELKGEEKPIDFKAGFQIADAPGGEKTLVLDTISTSREWLTVLISEYLRPEVRQIPLPKAAAAALKVLGI